MVTFLALLLLAIAGLYGYTVATSIDTVQRELEISRLNQLKFLADQLENDIDQLTLNAYNLLQDQSVRDYAILPAIEHLVDRNRLIMTITEKLKLQSTASAWTNTLTLYFPETGDMLSSDPNRALKPEYDFNQLVPDRWTFDLMTSEFILYVPDREQAGDMSVILSFPSENIRKLLASYEGQSRPYLYHPSGRFIFDDHTESTTAIRIAGQLGTRTIDGTLSMVTEANGMSYLLSAMPTVLDDWMLIEYTPLEHILQPIRKSTKLFAGATAVLLFLGVLFAFELYRNVQLPIRKLVSGLARFKEGDYGVRIGFVPAREFRLLTEGFNDMAKQVGDLIDKVLTEQLRAKEAEFKQLQSQINPHFLYNCLFFIKSKARVGDTESVEAMALSLGEYYRYMTRTDKDMVPLRSELDLIRNYVSILNLRKPRIDYVADIDEELMDLDIPRLLLQPLVENAVRHGIEPKTGRGTLRITGRRHTDGFVLAVEDDGVGMTDETLSRLRGELKGPKSEEGGYGVWNVKQRFVRKFGPGAVVEIDSKPGEGTTVTLRCDFRSQEGSPHDDSARGR
jgi:two-component system sensor histidine kinase YesM